MEALHGSLTACRDDDQNDVPDIVRIACHASLHVLKKYMDLVLSNDLYSFSIGIFFILKIEFN